MMPGERTHICKRCKKSFNSYLTISEFCGPICAFNIIKKNDFGEVDKSKKYTK